MDRLTKWTGVWFPSSRVLKEWNRRLKARTLDKRFDEIHAGSLFSLILGQHQRREYFIGFQTEGHIISQLTIAQLFELRPEMDRDIDLVLAPSEDGGPDPDLIHPIQIVRYINQPTSHSLSDDLIRFLQAKKFQIPKDDNLLLLVHIQQQGRINYLYIADRLANIACPFGQVFLMGKYTPENTHRWFCAMVHPKAAKLGDLDFSFLDLQGESQTGSPS